MKVWIADVWTRGNEYVNYAVSLIDTEEYTENFLSDRTFFKSEEDAIKAAIEYIEKNFSEFEKMTADDCIPKHTCKV